MAAFFTFTPDIRQFFAEYWASCTLFVSALLLLGSDDKVVSMVAAFACIWFSLVLGYVFWFFSTVQWVVNEQYIVFSRGVFNRSTDFVELYRIIDYKEEQNLIQQLFSIKTLIVYSGDRSHPSLRIYGLPEGNRIVEFIRENVEKQKQKKKIYEITNH